MIVHYKLIYFSCIALKFKSPPSYFLTPPVGVVLFMCGRNTNQGIMLISRNVIYYLHA